MVGEMNFVFLIVRVHVIVARIVIVPSLLLIPGLRVRGFDVDHGTECMRLIMNRLKLGGGMCCVFILCDLMRGGLWLVIVILRHVWILA